jgi:hypothetical protein
MPCRYCGNIEFKQSKEHIIPKALGGRLKIRDVCENCNNQKLSFLDKELTSKSPISLVLLFSNNQKSLNEFWLVGENKGQCFLEAKIDSLKQMPIISPQAIFSESGLDFWFDIESLINIGMTAEQFPNILMKNAKRALRKAEGNGINRSLPLFKRDKDLLKASSIDMPPRVFVRDLDYLLRSKDKVQLGYIDNERVRALLNEIDTWPELGKKVKFKSRHSSVESSTYIIFSPAILQRALAKISFNMLAYLCTNTEINLHNFPDLASYILGNNQSFVKVCKIHFIEESYNPDLRKAPKNHTVRIQHYSDIWQFHWSFFGSTVEAIVTFPGISKELWHIKEVFIPMNSESWKITEHTIFQNLIRKPKDWHNMFPGMPFLDQKLITFKGSRKF